MICSGTFPVSGFLFNFNGRAENEKEENGIFCEFRSNGPRVNDIAASFGGGGHMFAAGASLANWEKVDEIIKAFDENCRQFNNSK